jgi:hypothetical protein
MLPAANGDSLWIEYGEENDVRRILIDGGLASTYPALKQKVLDLPESERHFDLLVVTHVDADHIEGIIPLLGDQDLGLRFDDVWFNGWQHLAHPKDLLGPPQGEMLSALLVEGHYDWNKAFEGKPVVYKQNLPVIDLSGGMKITLLSPNAAALRKLRPEWNRLVREAQLIPGDTAGALQKLKKTKKLLPSDLLGGNAPDPQALASQPFSGDNRVANGSSIAFLAEYDGISCLFGADCHPRVLEESLPMLLAQTGRNKLNLDAFKIPHHGARSNLSPAILDLINCPRYLISTNGDTHSHPHLESIARILVKAEPYTRLYFNYSTEFNQIWQDPDLQNEYNYSAYYPQENGDGIWVEF